MILSFTIKERGKGLDTDHFILLNKEPSFTIIKKKKVFNQTRILNTAKCLLDTQWENLVISSTASRCAM